ncbi:MAG: hypothetical protein LBQ51_05825 [Desulfovibrio sp.]|nr:hypothetical protein [Desulfovibrio sp.]
MENIIIGVIVIAAGIFIVRRLITGRTCSCGREDCKSKHHHPETKS